MLKNGLTSISLGIAIVLFAALPSGAENIVGRFRSKMSKWVEVRELISKEKSDWIVDRAYLESTLNLLTQERDTLREEIEEFEARQTGSDEERRNLLLERGEFKRSGRAIESELLGLERQVLDVIPWLPEPLRDRLEPLLVQIPETPEQATAGPGQRLMNVLGVLAQTEKFNSTATLIGETRSVGGGQKIQVRSLYWGLGQAIYVDTQGRLAGIGRPTREGWVFTDDPDLTGDAMRLLDIYEGNVDTIAFIPIPVEIR